MPTWVSASQGPRATKAKGGSLFEVSNSTGERMILSVKPGPTYPPGFMDTQILGNDGEQDMGQLMVHLCTQDECDLELDDRMNVAHMAHYRRTSLKILSKSKMWKGIFPPEQLAASEAAAEQRLQASAAEAAIESARRRASASVSPPPKRPGSSSRSATVPVRPRAPLSFRKPMARGAFSPPRSSSSASSSRSKISLPPKLPVTDNFERLLAALVQSRDRDQQSKEMSVKDMQKMYRTNPMAIVRMDNEEIMRTLGTDDEYDKDGALILRPSWRMYTKSAIHPTVRANKRAFRELQTLAMGLDLLIAGTDHKKEQAMALLSRRFLAVEQATLDSSWELGAQQMELLPQLEESGASSQVQRAARAAAKEELKYSAELMRAKWTSTSTATRPKTAPAPKPKADGAKKKKWQLKEKTAADDSEAIT